MRGLFLFVLWAASCLPSSEHRDDGQKPEDTAATPTVQDTGMELSDCWQNFSWQVTEVDCYRQAQVSVNGVFYDNLQQAVEAALPGETIEVAQGCLTQGVVINTEGVTIRGDNTSLRDGGTSSFFHVLASGVRIEGFEASTLSSYEPGALVQIGQEGGAFLYDIELVDIYANSNSTSHELGGGAILVRDAEVRCENCVLISNQAHGPGGGIQLVGDYGADVTLSEGAIFSNVSFFTHENNFDLGLQDNGGTRFQIADTCFHQSVGKGVHFESWVPQSSQSQEVLDGYWRGVCYADGCTPD